MRESLFCGKAALWGRLEICSRLAIGLCTFATHPRRITIPIRRRILSCATCMRIYSPILRSHSAMADTASFNRLAVSAVCGLQVFQRATFLWKSNRAQP